MLFVQAFAATCSMPPIIIMKIAMQMPAMASPPPALRRLASPIPTAQRISPIRGQRNERMKPAMTSPGILPAFGSP